jgi:hypothetical protein
MNPELKRQVAWAVVCFLFAAWAVYNWRRRDQSVKVITIRFGGFTISPGFMVFLRGALAFTVGFLKPVSLSLHQHAVKGVIPQPVEVWDFMVSGLLGGAFMLISFMDGSYGAWRDSQKDGATAGGTVK